RSWSVSLRCSPPSPYSHSFPTRRSSDLMSTFSFPQPPDQATPASPAVFGSVFFLFWGLSYSFRKLMNHLMRLPPAHRPITSRSRSEEHTSELQSRFDLVCRLLLEKKISE